MGCDLAGGEARDARTLKTMMIPSLPFLTAILFSGLRLQYVVASDETNLGGVGSGPESDMDDPNRQLWSAENELQLEESDHPVSSEL